MLHPESNRAVTPPELLELQASISAATTTIAAVSTASIQPPFRAHGRSARWLCSCDALVESRSCRLALQVQLTTRQEPEGPGLEWTGLEWTGLDWAWLGLTWLDLT